VRAAAIRSPRRETRRESGRPGRFSDTLKSTMLTGPFTGNRRQPKPTRGVCWKQRTRPQGSKPRREEEQPREERWLRPRDERAAHRTHPVDVGILEAESGDAQADDDNGKEDSRVREDAATTMGEKTSEGGAHGRSGLKHGRQVHTFRTCEPVCVGGFHHYEQGAPQTSVPAERGSSGRLRTREEEHERRDTA
jgi:hypothetical protein